MLRSVRPSVCLSHSPAAAACGGFAAGLTGHDISIDWLKNGAFQGYITTEH